MNNSYVGILDYDCGNLTSVKNAFTYLGVNADTTRDPNKLLNYSHLVLPGVGSFRRAMSVITQRGLDDAIYSRVSAGIPLLGICLGMQLLGNRSSEDGETEGLGLIPADIDMFTSDCYQLGLKLPHVGFDTVSVDLDTQLFKGFNREVDFYFTHSYRMQCMDASIISGTSWHGEAFVSSVEHENIMGTQFHPEKSQQNGLRLLSNFLGTN